MDSEKTFKERIRVLEKLIKIGYTTDKKIIDMSIEDLIQSPNFNRSELTIAVGIKKAMANKNIVAFLCGINDENN